MRVKESGESTNWIRSTHFFALIIYAGDIIHSERQLGHFVGALEDFIFLKMN